MASAFTHGFLALSMGKTFFREGMPPKFWMFSLLCSVLPDMDVYGFYLGTAYGSLWGHRGFTHSLFFAFLLSVVIMNFGYREYGPFTPSWWKLWVFFFFLASSHGVLDAMTSGGFGVAFFSPFAPTRYSLPWTPLIISPLGLDTFFTSWGRKVIWSEITWVWLPSILIWGVLQAVRIFHSRHIHRKN